MSSGLERMVKQQHRVRPCAHIKADTGNDHNEDDNNNNNGRNVMRKLSSDNDDDGRYEIYMIEKENLSPACLTHVSGGFYF